MGRIQDFFGKLLKRENTTPALPEGATEKTFEDKQQEFKNSLNKIREYNEPREIVKEDSEDRKYTPKNFLMLLDWKNWYTNANIRDEYYRRYEHNNVETAKYKGALSVLPIDKTTKKIICTCLGEDRKPYQIELAKAKGMCYHIAIQEIDSIISLQVNGVFKGEQLQAEIQRHLDALKKIKDVELSAIGKEVLSYFEVDSLILPTVKEKDLYGEKIDFMNLPTKQTASQMPVTCVQADTQNQSLEEIDEKVEAFYEYCKLAIDIGGFEKKDWERIDDSYFIMNARNSSKDKKERATYTRIPQFKRESYEKIRDIYLTKEQIQQLKETMLSNSINKANEGYIGKIDIEELSMRGIVQEAMKDLPLRMEEYILAYQLMHENDAKYSEKLMLLNDMVNYSKQKFLEARGLWFDKKTKDVSIEEQK